MIDSPGGEAGASSPGVSLFPGKPEHDFARIFNGVTRGKHEHKVFGFVKSG